MFATYTLIFSDDSLMIFVFAFPQCKLTLMYTFCRYLIGTGYFNRKFTRREESSGSTHEENKDIRQIQTKCESTERDDKKCGHEIVPRTEANF